MKALLDTNILIDFLRGVSAARDEMNRYEERAISVITWMEVMAGASVEVNDKIAERVVALRRQYRMKLPDAIVWASAQVHSMLLVTCDTKGFPADDPGVRMPYRI